MTKAQDKVEISTDPPPPAMSNYLPVIKEAGKAKAFYNQKIDKTIVETPGSQVYGNFRNGIRLAVRFESSGKKVTKPSSITLKFSSSAQDRTYADNRALKIFIDGKEVLSETARFGEGNTNGQIFLISVTQDVPYDFFLKLISSQNIKMQIGGAKFELKEGELEALRDIKKILE
jgi:hypothetical protein